MGHCFLNSNIAKLKYEFEVNCNLGEAFAPTSDSMKDTRKEFNAHIVLFAKLRDRVIFLNM